MSAPEADPGPRTVLVLPAWYPTARLPLNGPFVRDHARAAAAYGHHIVVLVDEGPSEKVRGLFTLREEQDGELRVVRLNWRPSAGRVAYLLGVLLVARRLARGGTPVDVLHAHVHRMGWPAVLAGRLLRRPVVISEHSSEWPRRLLTPGSIRRARIAFPRAALVCPVSRHLRRAIESYGVRARFRVVPNTVDVGVFHPPQQMIRRPPTRLINVALHVEVKGLDSLLRAFAILVERRSSLTLELIGEGPLTSDLRRLAEELGVTDQVRFVGKGTSEQIAAALGAAHLFVLSSLSENMPLAVLEALCCGVPVVATDVGGVAEAVEAGNGALAPPGDVEALAVTIETVLDGYERFDRRGIARQAVARWSFQSVGGTWDEIYRSL